MKEFALLTLLILTNLIEARISKTWIKNNRLDDEDLWLQKRLPCAGQRVVLPEEETFFVPNGMKMGPEIILPQNGLLLFPSDNTKLVLVEKADDKCELKGDAVVRKPEFYSWHDPSNWLIEGDGALATPHTHRIPCRYDRVAFPKDAAFKVAVEDDDVTIAELVIDGEGLTTVDFRRMSDSWTFRLNKSVSIEGGHCADPAGCADECGVNDLNAICGKYVRCGETVATCSAALKPDGHCCYDICGAVVTVQTYGNEREELSMSVLRDLATTTYYTNYSSYAFRSSQNRYQIVFAASDRDAIVAAAKAAKTAETYLTLHGYYAWVEESGSSPPSPLTGIGKAFGFLIGLAAIVALCYWLKKLAVDQKLKLISWPSFSNRQFAFARFGGRDENIVEMKNEAQAENETNERTLETLDPARLTFKSLRERNEEEEDHDVAFEIDGRAKGVENPVFAKLVSIDQEEEKVQPIVKESSTEEKVNVEVNLKWEGDAKTVENPVFEKMASLEEVEKVKEEPEETLVALDDKVKEEAATNVEEENVLSDLFKEEEEQTDDTKTEEQLLPL